MSGRKLPVVLINGSAPIAVREEMAALLMEREYCQFATTTMPKQQNDLFYIVMDLPHEITSGALLTGVSHHLRYVWAKEYGSSVEEFLLIVEYYIRCARSDKSFASTRGGVPATYFLDAVKEGLGADGGLFMLQELPKMAPSQLLYFCETGKLNYMEAAQIIIEQLVDSSIHPAELHDFIKKAYAKERWSGLDNICPLRPLLERQQRTGDRWTRHVSVLELYHGPTAAFKDFALQLFPHYFHLSVTKKIKLGSAVPQLHLPRADSTAGQSSDRSTTHPLATSTASPFSPSSSSTSNTSASASSPLAPDATAVAGNPSSSGPHSSSHPSGGGSYKQFQKEQAEKKALLNADHYMILAATSGDTGVAAISGFVNINSPHIRVAVLYPLHGVSPVQQLQMLNMDDGHHVRVFGVKGDFDFCQNTVKDIFNSQEIKEDLSKLRPHATYLSSANSINWGRLVPQVTYYFWCYRQLVRQARDSTVLRISAGASLTGMPSAQLPMAPPSSSLGAQAGGNGSGTFLSSTTSNGSQQGPLLESMIPSHFMFGHPVDIVVPCGNFGNILGAFMAKLMGLPIRKLVVASNENDVLYEFITTGKYTIASRHLSTTASPSIDILIASNVERFLYLLSGGDTAFVSAMMYQLKTHKSFTLPEHLTEIMHHTFWAGKCSEEECAKTIREVFEASRGQRLLDTHTAVAVTVAQQYREEMMNQERMAALNDEESEEEDTRGRRGKGKKSKPPSPGGIGVAVPVTEVPLVIASTAHWSKFPDAVYRALRGRSMTIKFDPYSERLAAGTQPSFIHSSIASTPKQSLTSRPGTGSTIKTPPKPPNFNFEQLLKEQKEREKGGFDIQRVISSTLHRYREVEGEAGSHGFPNSLTPPHPALMTVLQHRYEPSQYPPNASNTTAITAQIALLPPEQKKNHDEKRASLASAAASQTSQTGVGGMLVRQLEMDYNIIVETVKKFCKESCSESTNSTAPIIPTQSAFLSQL